MVFTCVANSCVLGPKKKPDSISKANTRLQSRDGKQRGERERHRHIKWMPFRRSGYLFSYSEYTDISHHFQSLLEIGPASTL